MNTRTLFAAAALALAASGSALAQEATPDTWLDVAGSASRQAVHAEAVATVQAGHAGHGYGEAARFDHQPVGSTLTRAQVRAEAIEAMRLGLIGHGEASAPSPTMAQAEAIRQAGLRANAAQMAANR